MTTSAAEELDQTVPVEPAMLRRVCGLFVTGVTVITSGTGEEMAGTTVNSFASVSLDPPLVLFCLHNGSRLRAVVEGCGAFAVNFLAGRHARLARAFAGRDTAAIGSVPHHRAATGVPVLSEALASLSCRLVNAYDGGDHVIFVGEVVGMGAPSRPQQPLIFFRGSLSALEEEPTAGHVVIDG
jgi:3-hydroxy-9,10-secoandrosta-1,3,5(10)-triene-9,17-dione monooxygenase reductase component